VARCRCGVSAGGQCIRGSARQYRGEGAKRWRSNAAIRAYRAALSALNAAISAISSSLDGSFGASRVIRFLNRKPNPASSEIYCKVRIAVANLGSNESLSPRLPGPSLHRGYNSQMGCTYSPMDYANPDAPTQIANGISTSIFSYDNDGNLTQKTVDGTTTLFTITQIVSQRWAFPERPRPTDTMRSAQGCWRRARQRRPSTPSNGTP
jgi:hypothetical protein